MAEGKIIRRGVQPPAPAVYTNATGGTTLEYDLEGKRYRSHTFLDDGDFIVTTAGNGDRNQVDYLIIAGGGSGAQAGGGAGGYKTTLGTSGGPNPQTESKVTVTAQTYGIVVGAGGANTTGVNTKTNGNNSSALGITTIGGGAGGQDQPPGERAGNNGGSGGGSSYTETTRGLGTANQGFDGGLGNDISSDYNTGGGGGAGQAGQDTTTPNVGGNGGNGLSNILRTGSAETRAGGGGGTANSASVGVGGSGGGGTAGQGTGAGTAGEVNTGSGGGGFASGGSGIVVIRYEIAPST